MRLWRRSGAAGTAVALGALGSLGVLGLLGPAAGADPGAPYSVKASGVALKISVAGTSLVGGTSTASAGNGTAATAEGVGELTPAVVSDQKATAPSASTSQSLPQQCVQPSTPFPAPIGSLVGLGIGCSTASASQDPNGLPTASATGGVTSVTVGAPTTALPLPVNPGSALATTLQSVLGTLPALPTTGLPLGAVLAGVAAAANTNITSLVSATVGASTATVTATATTATASTQVQGTQINLLSGLGAGGTPLLSVIAGKATTSATLARSTAQVTAADTPGVVSVTLNSPVGGPQTVTIAPGASQTFLAGTPLATTIAVGSGTATSGAGKGSSAASGLTVDALQGLGASSATSSDGGIDIQIASATSAAAGTAPPAAVTAAATATPPPGPATPAAAAAPAPAPATVPGVTTVHTGEFWSGPLPIALLGLALLAGLALVARRRLLGAVCRINHSFRVTSSAGDLPPGPVSGTSSVPPPVSGPARRQSH